MIASKESSVMLGSLEVHGFCRFQRKGALREEEEARNAVVSSELESSSRKRSGLGIDSDTVPMEFVG